MNSKLMNPFRFATTWFFLMAFFISLAIVADNHSKWENLWEFWAFISLICWCWRGAVNHS